MNKRLIAIAAVICAAVLVIAGVIIAALHQKALPQQTQSAADSVRDASEADPETEPAETDAKGKKTGKASADKKKTDKDGGSPEESGSAVEGDADEFSDVSDDASDTADSVLPENGYTEETPVHNPQVAPETGDLEPPKQESVVRSHAPTPPGKVSSEETVSDDDDDDPSLPAVDLNQPEAEFDPAENGNDLPEVELNDEFETEED